ncbi:hypothetical protein K3G63_09635 [Hymenobacter sp. HSC-4F20]|uniref:hypothetical protein n=1 Tax=Hymenobacter sp. HSC-4F20 TaxID=2864135 RepID=UPI001C72F4D7|nr:hypothetical protein [Hymenobacter sp. HSC-4F20]MBX0290699.1 hypothetical protein [Hymenobacter sp. HSC-4F20]
MNTDKPSPQIIEQRIRNLLIEYVKMVSEYQADEMPGLTEIIYMWQDFVLSPSTLYVYQFQPPVYTLDEKVALNAVDDAWSLFSSVVTDQMIEKESIGLATSEWLMFVEASSVALDVLMRRGKLPED